MKTFHLMTAISLGVAAITAVVAAPAHAPTGDHAAMDFDAPPSPDAHGEITVEIVPEGYYSLIRINDDGSEYVIDHNMSIGDCYERMVGVQETLPSATWSCERQPDMASQPGGYIAS